MNIRLDENRIRVRLNGAEAETLLQINQLTITISWVTGTDLKVSMILSADSARPRVRADGLELLVVLPRSDFIRLLEQFGRKDAEIQWTEFGSTGQDISWSVEIDAFRSGSKNVRSQRALEALDLL